MIEAQWLASTYPENMLSFLGGEASERKLRYYAVACARRVLPASPDNDMIEALAVAERFADGGESRHRLARIRYALKRGHPARVSRWFPLYVTHIRSVPAWHATREKMVRGAREGAICCACSSTRRETASGSYMMDFPSEELAAQARLLRDIFGNPFRLVTISSAVLAWNDAVVVRLAQTAYEERHLPAGTLDTGRLAVLADALEEAGCSDADILGHLRGPGPHVRGCWVIDSLLGKS